MRVIRLLSALGRVPAAGGRVPSASARMDGSERIASAGTSRGPRAVSREHLLLLALLAFTISCVGDRERLAPPRLTMELLDSTVVPGSRVSVRLVAVDRNSDLASVAARARTIDSVFVQRQDLIGGVDSIEVVFDVYVASSARDGDPVEVTGSVINEQLLSRDTVAYAIVRVPIP
jgi:hypothetical protein